MPQMSLEEIKKTLAEGQSVFIRDSKGNLRHVTDPNRLPTEAELAKGDELAASQSLAFSRSAGVDPGQLGLLEAKVNELIAASKERGDEATKQLKAHIAELEAKLAAATPKPAPPTAPTQPTQVAAKPVEVKK
jgi:hypothetical protein